MDPVVSAKWMQLALEGGVCQGIAVEDFVAEAEDSLMFLKGDEIVVLSACEREGLYWGYCEGVLGTFAHHMVSFQPGVCLPTRPLTLPSPPNRTLRRPNIPRILLDPKQPRDESVSSFEFDTTSYSSSSPSSPLTLPGTPVNPLQLRAPRTEITVTSPTATNFSIDDDSDGARPLSGQSWTASEQAFDQSLEAESARRPPGKGGLEGGSLSESSLNSLGSLPDSFLNHIIASAVLPPGFERTPGPDESPSAGSPTDLAPLLHSHYSPTRSAVLSIASSLSSLRPLSSVRNELRQSLSSNSLSSDGRFEEELLDLFEAYGRESMYALPTTSSSSTSSLSVHDVSEISHGHPPPLAEDEDEDATIELVQALSTFSVLLSSPASPDPECTPRQSEHPVSSGVGSWDPLSTSGNLASALRNRILQRDQTAEGLGLGLGIGLEGRAGDEERRVDEDWMWRGAENEQTGLETKEEEGRVLLGSGPLSALRDGLDEYKVEIQPVQQTANRLEALPKEAIPTEDANGSETPLDLFQYSSETNNLAGRGGGGFAGVGARGIGLGGQKKDVVWKRERPRSKSFSAGQAVEIGFPMHNTSGPGDTQHSFVTLATAGSAPFHVPRPTLKALGLAELDPVDVPPAKTHTLPKRASERSLRSVFKRVEAMPSPSFSASPKMASSQSGSSPPLAPNQPISPKSTPGRSAVITLSMPSPQTGSPKSPTRQRGFKGFNFLRSKSESKMNPSGQSTSLPPSPAPYSPTATQHFPTESPPVLKSILVNRSSGGHSPSRPAHSASPSRSASLPPISVPNSPNPNQQPTSIDPPPALRSILGKRPDSNLALSTSVPESKMEYPNNGPPTSPLSPAGNEPWSPPPRIEKPRSASVSSTNSFRELIKSKTVAKVSSSKINPLHGPVSHTDFKESIVKEGKLEFELMKPLAQKLADKTQVETPPPSPLASSLRQTDEWGFFLGPGQTRSSSAPVPSELIQASEQKWLAIINGSTPSAAQKNKKVKKLLRSDLPPSLRGRVWAFLGDADSKRQAGLLEKLIDKAETTEEIEMECAQAYADHSLFGPSSSGRQDLLTIIKAYTQYNPRLTYQPDMASIAGCLSIHCPVEDAFWLFVSSIDKIKGYYDKALPIDSMCFVYLLEAVDKTLAKRLIIDCKVDPEALLRAWVLPMFIRVLPWKTVLHILDIFFLEGLTFLLRISLAILIAARDRLLDTTTLRTPEHVRYYLMHLPPDELVSAEKLIAVADGIKVGTKEDEMTKWRMKAIKGLADGRKLASFTQKKGVR